MSRPLYHPEKYRVYLGKGRDGLCTTWSDPEFLLKERPELLERFAIIGTLYSREGVSIILRNLALNPDIRRLYLWANSPLSRTDVGSEGWRLLKRVWEGDFSGVHKEIDLSVLEKITRNVELIDASEMGMDELLNTEKGPSEAYMEPVEFPEREFDDIDPLPSEGAGFLVRARKLWQAWLRAVDRIVRYGRIKGTEYGNRQKELPAVMWVFEEGIEDLEVPKWERSVLEKTKFISHEEYLNAFLSPEKPADAAYTYGNRLREFFGVDQVEWLVEKVRASPHTRRAVMVTYYPPSDEGLESPPCLNWLQVLERDGKLDLFAVFRSHDMFKAAVSNAVALMNLHKFISEKTGMERGVIGITSYSAHIYEEDWQDALDLLKCQLWERPKPWFDEREDTDPRGNVLVRIEENELVAELVAGDRRIEIRGKSAREVSYKLARLDLLSMPLHYVDIALELQKAETAMKLGLKYTQDRPLSLDKGLASHNDDGK